jgi:hypothetical protein
MSSDRTVLELINNPKLLKSAREKERASRRGAPGWSGLAPRFDAQIAMFGDRVEVTVHPDSPAARARMQTGDVVIGKVHVPELGEVPFQNLDQLKLRHGTEIRLRFARPSATGLLASGVEVSFKLAKWPQIPEWEKRQQVAPGRRVKHPERMKFLQEMIPYLAAAIPPNANGATSVAAQATRFLLLLVTRMNRKRDDSEVFPRHETSAKDLGLSIRYVWELDQMLRWFGIFAEVSNKSRRSKTLAICWPDPAKPIIPKPTVPTAPAAPSTPTIRRVRL